MRVEGKNPVRELLASGKSIDKVYVLDGTRDLEIREFVRLAKGAKAKIEWVDKLALDKLSATGRHQGIIAEASEFEYQDIEQVLAGKTDPLLLLLDDLTDPHNLGSCIRVAECVGATAVVIPSRHACLVNETVMRAAAGATAHMPVCKVGNLNDTIKWLKNNNVWVYGADMDGESMYKTDLTGGVAIVIGAEGKGLSPLTAKLCDKIISIPMHGKVDSLNASVSAAVLLYEADRQRRS